MNKVSMDAARRYILQKYHASPDARLSSGMEAEVYTYGPDAVLKLYTGTSRLADFHILLSRRANGDWHQFLARYLTHKLAQVTPYLRRDVPQFVAKVQHLHTVLDQPYRGDYRLIHGDFFPGNLLLNDNHEITALLDFGLLTMYGDYLFDLATGWVFFDMYDELKAQVRERYLAMLLERLGAHVRGKLYRYVLIYSILSANTYSSHCTDGHYQWCVANLSNQHYWHAIE